jgi:hypothetical protein
MLERDFEDLKIRREESLASALEKIKDIYDFTKMYKMDSNIEMMKLIMLDLKAVIKNTELNKSNIVVCYCRVSTKGQLDDLDYFLNKLYHSLNVPISRMKPDTGFSIGRSDTISRDEIKFGKFVEKLRVRFNSLFLDLLRVQLVAKGICSLSDWDQLKDKIKLEYAQDNHFSELKENEILNTRLASLQQIDPFVGKYVSKEWVQRHVMRFTDEEIEEINKQVEDEGPSPEELAAMGADGQGTPPN